jgi:hypothetical protein
LRAQRHISDSGVMTSRTTFAPWRSLLLVAAASWAHSVQAAPPDEHPPSHAMSMDMGGALGDYPMPRDASGTSWQPDASVHDMGHLMRGDWTLMGHVMLDGTYDWQDGPRGDELAFVSGMVMGSAQRKVGEGDALMLRAMLSPDPFMGKRGYPLLLQAGETADGVTPLVDRQHPHDLFMELSATWAHQFGAGRSAFFYAGLPGEAAFGPPAFMHRPAAMMSPEAPITHHWLDSTHIVFGVLTAGWVRDQWKFEASQFTGREPDEDRYDIERPRLDSTSLRVSWNPNANWALQLSWADVESPEQLEPEVDARKYSASALYGRDLGGGRSWAATIAWGRKEPTEGPPTDVVALEASWVPARDWQVFSRIEWIESNELGGDHHDVHEVAKLTIGARREFPLTPRIRLGLGALYTLNELDAALAPSYGGSPVGAMVFVQFLSTT